MNIKKVILSKISNIIEIKSIKANEIDSQLDKLASLIAKSPAIVHFYPTCDEKLNIDFAQKLRQLTSIFNSYFVVVNRLDIAKIAESDGVLFNKDGYNYKYFDKFFHDDKFIAYDFKNAQCNLDIKNFDYVINSSAVETFNIIEL